MLFIPKLSLPVNHPNLQVYRKSLGLVKKIVNDFFTEKLCLVDNAR